MSRFLSKKMKKNSNEEIFLKKKINNHGNLKSLLTLNKKKSNRLFIESFATEIPVRNYFASFKRYVVVSSVSDSKTARYRILIMC